MPSIIPIKKQPITFTNKVAYGEVKNKYFSKISFIPNLEIAPIAPPIPTNNKLNIIIFYKILLSYRYSYYLYI